MGKCNKNNLSIKNATFTPKREEKGGLVTWMCGGGEVQRRMGYLIIIDKRKNWVKKTEVKGQANINQMYQRKTITMEVDATLKKQEKKREKNT